MKVFLGCLVCVVILVFLAIVTALPVMLLWNAVIPDITKNAVTEIGFWQALGLCLLCHLLMTRQTSINT